MKKLFFLVIVMASLNLPACEHIPRGDVMLPERSHSVTLPVELALPEQVTMPDGTIAKVPDSCEGRFRLVKKALAQDLQASPPDWVVAILEHDAAGAADLHAYQPYPPAQDLFARMTLEGDGVAENSIKAFNLALEAARQGYVPSQVLVAVFYTLGHGIAVDAEQAFNWLREAARGSVVDLSREGDVGRDGRDEADDRELDHSVRAAQVEAMAMLGDAYRQGLGVAKDYEEAFLWTYKAAYAGDFRARWWLGLHYYYGWGTHRDKVAAYALCRSGQEAGGEEGAAFLSALEAEMTASERRAAEKLVKQFEDVP